MGDWTIDKKHRRRRGFMVKIVTILSIVTEEVIK